MADSTVTLEQTEDADLLLGAMSVLEELGHQTQWWRANPYRPLEPRDAYHEGQADAACKLASGAIWQVLLQLRHCAEPHGALGRYAIRIHEQRQLDEENQEETP